MVNAKAFKDGFTWLIKGSKAKFPIIIDSNGMHFLFEDKQLGKMFLTYKGVTNDEKVIIPYQSFAGIKKMFKYWKADLSLTMKQLSTKDFEAQISDGDHPFKYTFDRQFVPAEDYSKDFGTTSAEGIFNVNELAESAGRLAPFASTDNCRFFMNGIYIDSENKVLVATDGRRLGYLSYESELPSMIVTVNTFAKAEGMGEVIYTVSKNDDRWFKIENDNLIIVSKLIDGQFPNWKRVVPSTTENSVMDTINLDSFTQAAKYAVDVVGKKIPRAMLENGTLAGIAYKHSNDIEAVIALNATYLKESLEKMKGESVNFYAQTDADGEVEDMKAIMISDGTLNAIIMPMCKDA